MLNKTFNLRKNKYLNLVFIALFIIYIIFSIAFLPIPSPTVLGLDPSWQYAISKAAEDNLIFGKDIVFTYGPLGYLVHGSTLKSNFWQIVIFHWFIQFCFFGIILIRIGTLKNQTKKVLLALSFGIIIYFIKINFWVGLLVDYQILYIFLTILTFENIWKKYPIQLSFLMGIFSGFCLLTKFSLGIYTFGFLVLFNFVNLYQSIKLKSTKDIITNITAITTAILAFFSSAWLGLVPNQFSESLIKIMVNIIIAVVIVWLIFSLINKNKDRLVKINNKSINYWFMNLQDQGLLIPIAFCLIYSIFITYSILFTSSTSLIDYIYNSLQISSGYSSAMSVIGNSQELIIGLFNCGIIIGLLFLLAKNGYLNLSLGLLFITWIAFKHGFIRHDGSHYLLFSQTILFIIFLCLTKIKSIRQWKISFCLYLYIMVNSMVTLNSYSDLTASIFTRLNNNWQTISNTSWLKSSHEEYSNQILSKSEFPNNIKEIIGDKTIDIIPWDISIAPANNLNWQPRPIFQSYSAYTSYLDNLNFQNFVDNPRDYLLYTFIAIDARHPFFDEPKTFSFVHCNYAPIEVIEGDFDPVFTPIFLLKKQINNACSSTKMESTMTTKWNQIEALENNNNSLIKAEIKIKYSLWGKFYKTIFRTPPVMVNVKYKDNSERKYRIIPENANNGVIFSHLPRDNQEALLFLSGEKNAQVKLFSFFNQNNSLYKSDIEINLFSYELNQQ